jgi:hypothetical protein
LPVTVFGNVSYLYISNFNKIVKKKSFFPLLLVLNDKDVDPHRQPVLTNEVNGTMFYFLHKFTNGVTG